jgi:hypothetical protein
LQVDTFNTVLTLTLAHQFLAQVPEGLRQAAFGNCGSFISLRCGAEDAPLIAQHLTLENPRELLELPDYRALGRFLQDGAPSNIMRMKLPPPDEVRRSHAEQIKRQTRHRYSKGRADVEGKIERFLTPSLVELKGKRRPRRESRPSRADWN